MFEYFYHQILRKTVIAFGSLFNDITIKHTNSADEIVSVIKVPLAYGPTQKFLARLEQSPDLSNPIQITLPRMSFEILGYSYDSSRKLNRMQQIKCGDGSTATDAIYTPVPYNIDVSLYILTKTQEDALQILEQILPTFTPEYTLTINAVPDMNVKLDIPIVLNSVTSSDEYDGDFQTRRNVTHTLTFTIKTNLFGPVVGKKVIDEVFANIGQNENFSNPNRIYTAEGDVTTATVDTESWTSNF
jgi:hypothetical protein